MCESAYFEDQTFERFPQTYFLHLILSFIHQNPFGSSK
jgi:hypothetical protein